jgi:hypothetical protein
MIRAEARELDVVVQVVNRHVGREVLAQPLGMYDDTRALPQPWGVGIDRRGGVVGVYRRINDASAASDAVDPAAIGRMLHDDHDVTFRLLPGFESPRSVSRGEPGHEIGPHPLPGPPFRELRAKARDRRVVRR